MREKDIEKLQLIKLKNKKGTQLEILNFGASVFRLLINGVNVVVSPATPEVYLQEIYHKHGKHFGASVGRHAGRISQGGFQINDEKFALFEEDGIHIHGGKIGFTYQFWEVISITEDSNPTVVLEHFSPDGEEGYPGNLRVQVKYTLTEADEIMVKYTAETDKDTVLNLTNHTYFNLNGSGSINHHLLRINAEKILEADENNFPTGNFLEVAGSEVDFREEKKLGNIFLDTVFELKGSENSAFLKGDKSGISMAVSTNQPAVVVYVPEVLPDDWDYSTPIGKARAAICLETQKFPDAPHHAHFPSVIVKKGELYENWTTWRFETGS